MSSSRDPEANDHKEDAMDTQLSHDETGPAAKASAMPLESARVVDHAAERKLCLKFDVRMLPVLAVMCKEFIPLHFPFFSFFYFNFIC